MDKNEAIKIIRSNFPTGRKMLCEALEILIPELKESEDEKMMNQLHSWMKEFGGAEEYTEKVYQWIKGLLEKQGEQKPDFCNHEVDFSDCSEEYRKAYYDGWNNCNQQHAQLEANRKPHWSREDSCCYDDICEILINLIHSPKSNVNKDVVQKDLDWLKSLKERMKGE